MENININSSVHTEAEELLYNIGKTVSIHGIIYKIREMSGFAFVILQTKTVQLQCVYVPEFSNFSLHELKCNMAVVIKGRVIREERSRSGYEVRIIDFEPLSCPVEETPIVINNKEIVTSLESLLDYRPITLRNVKERAIFKIQAGICEGFRAFFQKHKFTEIHSPKIVSGGAEGGANIFPIDYFGKQAYLCQSPQFYKQIMVEFMEAKEMIASAYHRPITDWEDFEPEEEKLLCELIKKQTGSELVFVTHYKSSKRPFYTMDNKENSEFTDSFDLLFRGMEVTTGGQRIHSYTEQVAKMERLGMNVECFPAT